MATAAQIKEREQTRRLRNAEHTATMLAVMPLDTVSAVLKATVERLKIAKGHIETDRFKGGTTEAREHGHAIRVVLDFLAMLAATAPTVDAVEKTLTALPEGEPLMSGALLSLPDLKARLRESFGPELDAPVVTHIVLSGAADDAPKTWCQATTGVRGYRGAATCADCIALFDATSTMVPDIVVTHEVAAQIRHSIEPTTEQRPDNSDPGERVGHPMAEQRYRLLVTGSRNWTDAEAVTTVLDAAITAHPRLTIVHGDCQTGADNIADQWGYFMAKEGGADITVERYPVTAGEWAKYGKAAGPLRNKIMVDSKPDGVAAFVLDGSKGATGTVELARAAGIPFVHEEYRTSKTPDPEPTTTPEGYSLEFIDPEPPRYAMTPAQVRAHGQARHRGADHRSPSQVSSYNDCGTRYALGDLEPPQWANVGGVAVHAAIARLNLAVAAAQSSSTAVDLELLPNVAESWPDRLNLTIAQTIDQTGVKPDRWRVNNKGLENGDWWRVEGAEMLKRYTAWLTAQLNDGWMVAYLTDPTANPAGSTIIPAVEYPFTLSVPGLPVPVRGIIDLVLWQPATQQVRVVDPKSGRIKPSDAVQLGTYAAAVWQLTGVPLDHIDASYLMVRRDYTAMEESYPAVLVRHTPPDVLADLYVQQYTAESAGLYPARPSTFCGGCGVINLCPVKGVRP
jgi:PD-(D/E)XK nuclease superfamily/YspA, cpYpsA-related SLOG family